MSKNCSNKTWKCTTQLKSKCRCDRCHQPSCSSTMKQLSRWDSWHSSRWLSHLRLSSASWPTCSPSGSRWTPCHYMEDAKLLLARVESATGCLSSASSRSSPFQSTCRSFCGLVPLLHRRLATSRIWTPSSLKSNQKRKGGFSSTMEAFGLGRTSWFWESLWSTWSSPWKWWSLWSSPMCPRMSKWTNLRGLTFSDKLKSKSTSLKRSKKIKTLHLQNISKNPS